MTCRGCERVYLAACGTSYYACLVAKYAWEEWLQIPVETVIASEFRYAPPPLDESVLFVAVSQSGETADTRRRSSSAATRGTQTVAITNVVDSALTLTAAAVVYLQVGPEIGVVATKTFTGQLAVLYTMGLYAAARRGTLPAERTQEMIGALEKMPALIARALAQPEQVQRIAGRLRERGPPTVHRTGRGLSDGARGRA